eukprot:7589404-Heterocapsa_arctica.AAC.1
MDVSKTLLSVSELKKNGYEVVMGQRSALVQGSGKVSLLEVDGLFFLKVWRDVQRDLRCYETLAA